MRSFSDNDDITYFFKLNHDVMMKIFPFHPFVINFLKLAKEDFIFSTSFLILGKKCYFLASKLTSSKLTASNLNIVRLIALICDIDWKYNKLVSIKVSLI